MKNKYKLVNIHKEIASKLPSMKIQIDLNTLNKGSFTSRYSAIDSSIWCLRQNKSSMSGRIQSRPAKLKSKSSLSKRSFVCPISKDLLIKQNKIKPQKKKNLNFKSGYEYIISKHWRNQNLELLNTVTEDIHSIHSPIVTSSNSNGFESPAFDLSSRSKKYDIQTDSSDFTWASINLTNSFYDNDWGSSIYTSHMLLIYFSPTRKWGII